MTFTESPDDLAPTVEVVYRELVRNTPMTQRDLIDSTNLPFRPVRDALEQLKQRDNIEELVYSNGRLRLYLLDESRPESAEQQVPQVA